MHHRSLICAVSTVAQRRLMETWRTEPNEHGFVKGSWVRQQKQDVDVHKNTGPADRPTRQERRKGVQQKSGQQSMPRWRHERQTPWPNPTARQARVPRATPRNRVNIVKQTNNKEDDIRQPSRCGSQNRGPNAKRPHPARVMMALKHHAIEACQPIAAQVAQMGKIVPNFTRTTSLQVPHEQQPPPQRQHQQPPRPLGRLPHGKPNV